MSCWDANYGSETKPVDISIDLRRPAAPWQGFGSTIFSFQEPEMVERLGGAGAPAVGEMPGPEVLSELLRMVYSEVRLTRGRVFPFRYEEALIGDAVGKPAADWTAEDFAQRGVDRVLDFIQPARKLGLREVLGTLGKPPSHLVEPNGRTLREDAYPEYVERVVRLLSYWREKHGVELAAWALFNEPSFPPDAPAFLSPAGHLRLTLLLGPALENAGLRTRIYLADDWTPRHRTLEIAHTVLEDLEARRYICAVGYHNYDGYDFLEHDWRSFEEQRKVRKELRDLCERYSVQAWMTEISNFRPSTSPWQDIVFMASQIHDDLTCAGVTAWDFMLGPWQGGWRGNARGGPQGIAEFYYEPDGSVRRVQLTHVATVIGHWSRVISPGWRQVPATSSDAETRLSAFLSPDGRQCVCIILNDAPPPRELKIRVTGAEPAPRPVAGFRSDPITRWGEIHRVLPESGSWNTRIPVRSITTMTLELKKAR